MNIYLKKTIKKKLNVADKATDPGSCCFTRQHNFSFDYL